VVFYDISVNIHLLKYLVTGEPESFRNALTGGFHVAFPNTLTVFISHASDIDINAVTVHHTL